MALTICASAMAQGTFTIRRPVDGSKVKEVIKVRIPKNSIPDGGYVGIYLDGKFLEAVMPDVDGEDYVYQLDSQAKDIADGEHTIEAVLFVDFSQRPRIVNRTSVKVVVENKSSIKMPEKGFSLRYNFTPGKEHRYMMTQKQTISMISQAMAQVGGRAAERSLEVEKFRMMYAVDNAYNVGNGRKEGLVRIQPLPDKGRDFAYITVAGETEPKKYYDYEMAPVYMRVTDTGREKFSGMPSYFPLEGTSGDASTTDLLLLLPLPVLPTQPVKPGSVWQDTFLLGSLKLDDRFEVDKYTQGLPARGEFVGLEWRNGIPCAKLKTTIAVGAKDLKNVKGLNQVDGDAVKLELNLITWFALDRGKIIRMEENIIQEALVDPGSGGGGPSSGGGGGNSGGPTAPLPSKGGGRGGAPLGGPSGVPGDDKFMFSMDDLNSSRFIFKPTFENGEVKSFFQLAAGGGVGQAPPDGGSSQGRGQGGFGSRAGGGSSNTKQILRITMQIAIDAEN